MKADYPDSDTPVTLTESPPAAATQLGLEALASGRLAFSVQETALILGISEKTVRRLVQRKLLRASRALRHLLIPRKEIERFLEQTLV